MNATDLIPLAEKAAVPPVESPEEPDVVSLMRSLREALDDVAVRVQDVRKRSDNTLAKIAEARRRTADVEKHVTKLGQPTGQDARKEASTQGLLLANEMLEKKLRDLRAIAEEASGERDALLFEIERLANEGKAKDAQLKAQGDTLFERNLLIKKQAGALKEAKAKLVSVRTALRGQTGK
jgi:hypothetical protein